MTTRVIIKHDGSLPAAKNLLVTRSYIKNGRRERIVDVAVELKLGNEIKSYVWDDAIIEIREAK